MKLVLSSIVIVLAISILSGSATKLTASQEQFLGNVLTDLTAKTKNTVKNCTSQCDCTKVVGYKGLKRPFEIGLVIASLRDEFVVETCSSVEDVREKCVVCGGLSDEQFREPFCLGLDVGDIISGVAKEQRERAQISADMRNLLGRLLMK